MPLDGLRGSGAYIYFLLLSVWAALLVIISLYWSFHLLNHRGLTRLGSRRSAAALLFVLLLGGVMACSLRTLRGVLSPLSFSPRFASYPE